MRRWSGYAVFAAVLVAAGTFWACNDRLDDPTVSEGLLTVEKVDPSIVEADRDDTDPNGVLQPGFGDDEVNITLRNRPRIMVGSQFTDIFIKQYVRLCTFNGNPVALNPAVIQTAFTINSGSTQTVSVLAVTANEKMTLSSDGDTWFCSVQFSGEDVAGNPANSEIAGFSISLVDR